MELSDLQRWLVDRVDAGLAELQWSQARLAEVARLSQKHLSQMLNGREQGSLAAWDRLLRAVGKHPHPRDEQ